MLDFFDEKGAKDCGVCDVCLECKRSVTNLSELSVFRNLIVAELSRGPVLLQDLHAKFNDYPVENITNFIRQLQDEGTLKVYENNEVSLE